MKNRTVNAVFASIFLLAAQAGNAAAIQLNAADGTRISVGYDARSVYVDNHDISNTMTDEISGLAFTLSNFGFDTTAVLTVSCTSGLRYSLSCRRDSTGWIHVNNGCDLNADAYTRRFLGNDFARLHTKKTGHGLYERCGFELSVVRDGQWLVDPVNGTHNFKLMF